MVHKVLRLLVVWIVCCGFAASENILFLQTLYSRSHHIWNKQIFDRLYENGHNLTILSFEPEKSIPGKTFIVIDDFHGKILAEEPHVMDFVQNFNSIQNIMHMYRFISITSRLLVREEAVHRLLAYPKTFKFDLIIHDCTMGQLLLGFVEYFGNPPLVQVSAFNVPPHIPSVTDAPLRTTLMPHYSTTYGPRMSFLERVANTVYWLVDIFYREQLVMRLEEQHARQLFGEGITPVSVIERRADLTLVNNDLSLDYYQVLPPNVISVAGLHVSRSDKVFPVVEGFIARAGKGIVLLSFGTNVGSEMLGEEVNRQIMEIFRSMPEYGFIWKHAKPDSLGLMPPNVLILPWVPQSAILANQRTKLFISHAGLLSIQEAIWYGVPMLTVPFFVDQYANAAKVVRAGCGLRLPPRELTEQTLKDSIKTILADPSFRQNAKERSYWFKGQPQPPLDRAVFWIERVMENKGLPHLRSPVHEMNIFQLYGLDMVAVILGIAYLIKQSCCHRNRSKNVSQSRKEKKN